MGWRRGGSPSDLKRMDDGGDMRDGTRLSEVHDGVASFTSMGRPREGRDEGLGPWCCGLLSGGGASGYRLCRDG